MSQYRKKAVVIDAVQFMGNFAEIEKFVGGDAEWRNGELIVATLEGPLRASQGDYIIKGVKGEFYPCKPDIFEMTYDRVGGGMSFGAAIEALKAGKKVARSGWNGKGMWVVLMPELKLPPHSSQEPGARVNDRTAKHIGVDTPLHSQPYIAMWTAAQQWQPGWLASQADILAEDWQVVE